MKSFFSMKNYEKIYYLILPFILFSLDSSRVIKLAHITYNIIFASFLHICGIWRNIWFTKYIWFTVWLHPYRLTPLLFGALFLKSAWVPMIELFCTENKISNIESDTRLSNLTHCRPRKFVLIHRAFFASDA